MAQWCAHKAARQAVCQVRQVEDEVWRQARQDLHTRRQPFDPVSPPPTHVWLAILVIVDNCTRRCLGLPLFTAGAHVTSEMVVAALRQLLPAELQFLISDNGPQFKADAFAELARTANFIHVRIAPRRACTNGIAERFVQTLKDWLAQHAWTTPEELERLLVEFLAFYNDRPHQGTELNGLSPNEYACRLANYSTC
jgi:transposase InsO family protein